MQDYEKNVVRAVLLVTLSCAVILIRLPCEHRKNRYISERSPQAMDSYGSRSY